MELSSPLCRSWCPGASLLITVCPSPLWQRDRHPEAVLCDSHHIHAEFDEWILSWQEKEDEKEKRNILLTFRLNLYLFMFYVNRFCHQA